MVLLGTSLVLTIYSLYAPFIIQMRDIKGYNIAYYGAYGSMERAMLILRHRDPWFEWSWWWLGDTNVWPRSDHQAGTMSFLSLPGNGTTRSISSRTTQIPRSWDTDINRLFADQSKWWNWLRTNQRIRIPLMIDRTTSPNDFYSSAPSLQKVSPSTLDIWLRLNPTLAARFAWPALNTNDWLYGAFPDDELIGWSVDGFMLDGSNRSYFRIFKYDGMTYFGSAPSMNPQDMAIRESLLNARNPITPTNAWPSLRFRDTFQPLQTTIASERTWHNVASQQADSIRSLMWNQLFADSRFTDISLSLAWIAMPVSQSNDIYPFTEYRVEAWGAQLADLYYTITTQGKVGAYNVVFRYKKPAFDMAIAGDFTVFF